MDPTVDPALRSFVDTPPECGFPIQNLPYCAFVRPDAPRPRVGVGIGAYVLDLCVLERAGCFEHTALASIRTFDGPTLNPLLALGRRVWHEVRDTISRLLRCDESRLRDDAVLRDQALIPQADVHFRLPVDVGDYTDFYSSKHHAFNVGKMFRGAADALQPNYVHVPIGYHGRASSIVLSGAALHRPRGQLKAPDADAPTFGPSREVDFELEMGFFVGPANTLGQPIPIDRARAHIFGLVLCNDWSARDIQRWEYVPLGPFLSKNFGTSLSPWVVPLEALEPFACAAETQSPPPLPYLLQHERTTFDVALEVALITPRLDTEHIICRSNFRHLYWTMEQQLAHHTCGGCNMRPGDLLASGTISGPTPESWGSLLELARRGEQPLTLPNGEQRTFLADGDTVVMRAACAGADYRVNVGEVCGTILPPIDAPSPDNI